tara:strand:+ start:1102 stop:1419 length:318 start_codon:yes stop_codon:yes gene_type:complete
VNLILYIPIDDEMQSHPLDHTLELDSDDILSAAAALAGEEMVLRSSMYDVQTPYGFIAQLDILSLANERGEYNITAKDSILAITNHMMAFQGDVVLHLAQKELIA